MRKIEPEEIEGIHNTITQRIEDFNAKHEEKVHARKELIAERKAKLQEKAE
jgi:hypothetical protein